MLTRLPRAVARKDLGCEARGPRGGKPQGGVGVTDRRSRTRWPRRADGRQPACERLFRARPARPIRLRCDIERADAILCFDASLLDARLLSSAGPDTLIVVNSARHPDDFA